MHNLKWKKNRNIMDSISALALNVPIKFIRKLSMLRMNLEIHLEFSNLISDNVKISSTLD